MEMPVSNMPIRIQYIPLPDEKGPLDASHQETERSHSRETLLRALAQAVEALPEGPEFLRLRCLNAQGAFAYYSRALDGILADFVSAAGRQALEPCSQAAAKRIFAAFDARQAMRVFTLPAGLLREDEYQRLKSGVPEACRGLEALPAAVVAPPASGERCLFHGRGETFYGIPVFRCSGDMDYGPPGNTRELLVYLIGKGFVPELEPVNNMPPQELLRCLRGPEPSAPLQLLRAGPDSEAEEEKERWQRILQFYNEAGLRAAHLEPYPPRQLQADGSWDLYPFAGLDRDSLRPEDGPWCEVSAPLYARDPRGDLATDAQYVAIDFGTTRTLAAIYQNGVITTIPVGGGTGPRKAFNPTILKFADIKGFLEAYERKPFRPDTLFDQVSASHIAQNDFESAMNTPLSPAGQDGHEQKPPAAGGHMFQYLNHLKQWVNTPEHTLCLRDAFGQDIKLGQEMDAESLTVDPIELYAYYIGLAINDMRWKTVYRRYLLSYPATYSVYSREWIRSCFEKGLRKALPKEVGESVKLDVRLWRDEATSYAICALDRFLREGQPQEEKLRELRQGLFYGIYDFGGGTLDFSFGVMRVDERTGNRTFKVLRCGGSPVLGCENILDELAFLIFSQNAENFARQAQGKNAVIDIKCAIPIGSDPRQYINAPIASDSEAARYNTCNLTAFLRRKWIKMGEAPFPQDEAAGAQDRPAGSAKQPSMEEEQSYPLRLLGESGARYEWIENSVDQGSIQMNITEDMIRNFFEKKVTEGIQLFLNWWRAVCADESGKPYSAQTCHIFLAGSASQSSLVQKLFQQEIQELKLSDGESARAAFQCHPPLPTEQDRMAQKGNASLDIPTSKSGVVYGLLMSRPGASGIVVEQKTGQVDFHYHIGCWKYDVYHGGQETFRLLLNKTDIPRYESKRFRRLCEVEQPAFELLYTFDDSFAMTSQPRELNSTVHVLSVQIPEGCAWTGQHLYIRAMPSSDTLVQTAISALDQEELPEDDQLNVIGLCDFAHGVFTPCETPPPSPASDRSKPSLSRADQERLSSQRPRAAGPKISPAGADGPNLSERQPHAAGSKASSDSPGRQLVRLGCLPAGSQTPKWVKYSESKAPVKVFFGDFTEERFTLCWEWTPRARPEDTRRETLSIPLEGAGKKRLFFLGAAPPAARFLCTTSQGGRYILAVDLNTKEIRKE